MYAEFTKKRVFEILTVGAGSLAGRHHGRQKVLIPEYDLTGRRVMVDLLPVRSQPVRLSPAYLDNVMPIVTSSQVLLHYWWYQ